MSAILNLQNQINKVEGSELDYLVAVAVGATDIKYNEEDDTVSAHYESGDYIGCWDPSQCWEVGGPLIEKFNIQWFLDDEQPNCFYAGQGLNIFNYDGVGVFTFETAFGKGDSILKAAMRAIILSNPLGKILPV